MNVEKVIRILGYIVYITLWSPIIILSITFIPLAWTLMDIRAGRSAKEGFMIYKEKLIAGIQHDIVFIRTGKW